MGIPDRIGRFIRSKNIKARPSKTYFHRHLNRDLDTLSHCKRAADMASANLKNAHLFRSATYFGVDIDEDSLRNGLVSIEDASTDYVEGPLGLDMMTRYDNCDNQTYVAVHGDIRKPLFPPDSLDLIASTHTLSHLPPRDHVKVVEKFCDALRPGGTLLLQLAEANWFEGRFRRQINNAFETVETIHYGTPLSLMYERLVADDGAVVLPHEENLFRHYLMVLASATLLQIEKIWLLGGQSLYLRCTGYEMQRM